MLNVKSKFLKKEIYEIGYGCGIGNYNNAKHGYREVEKVIKSAIDLGVNIFDTAKVYGNGLSEKILGKCIKGKRNKIIIATKVPPEMLSRKGIITSTNESLKNLKIDRIDLLQLHWPNEEVDIRESMDALLKLKEQKKIQNIGLCNYNFIQLKKIVKLYPSLISSYQAEYNLINREMDGKFNNFLIKNHIKFLCYSPLAKGMICANAGQKKFLKTLSVKYNMEISHMKYFFR